MLSRKEQNHSGIFLPEKWKEKVETTLFSLYQNQCEKGGKSFQVYGLTYPNEVFLAVSYLDQDDLNKLPVTYAASADLEKEDDPKKLFDLLVDSIGVFYDSFFSSENWNEYISVWTETKHKNQTFYYQVTREIVSLTIQANQMLNT